jgi:hypothetical protein
VPKVKSISVQTFDGTTSSDVCTGLLCLKVNEALKVIGTADWCAAKQKALIEYGVAAEIQRLRTDA